MANLLKDLGFYFVWEDKGVVEVTNTYLNIKFDTNKKNITLSSPRYDKRQTLRKILDALEVEESYGIDGSYFFALEDERRAMDFDEEPRYRKVTYGNLLFHAPDSTLWNDMEELLD